MRGARARKTSARERATPGPSRKGKARASSGASLAPRVWPGASLAPRVPPGGSLAAAHWLCAVSLVMVGGCAPRPLKGGGGPDVTKEGEGSVARGDQGVQVVSVAPEDFVLVEKGTFMMGSPKGEEGHADDEVQHEVTLTRSFWMQKTEVTQGQWRALMGNNPSYFSSCGEKCPVEMVNWFEALAYANAVSRQEGFEECFALTGCTNAPGEDMKCTGVSVNAPGGNVYECQGYRLPTEAEWEYAARAGEQTAFITGGIAQTMVCSPLDGNLDRAGWYCGNSAVSYAGCDDLSDVGGPACAGTNPVGQKQANGFGLFDVHGNVREWIWDLFQKDYESLGDTDPVSNGSGFVRAARGGSYGSQPQNCRAASRNYDAHGVRLDALGFRLSRSAGG